MMYMIGKYKVVTLCGSTKFKEDFIAAQEKLTLEGNIVITVGMFGHADNKYNTVITDEIKKMLDDMHRRRIDISDFIYVINKDGYIGENTKSEIEYAESLGKCVRYMYPTTQDDLKFKQHCGRCKHYYYWYNACLCKQDTGENPLNHNFRNGNFGDTGGICDLFKWR